MTRTNLLRTNLLGLALLAITMAVPAQASAFCGFYVSGASDDLYNDATRVVMMRDGTKTVLSMQNTYKGPTEDFAMIVPVPEVLQKENVKVLEDQIFEKVDRLASPRLVEYWERNPCYRARTGKSRSGVAFGLTGSSQKKMDSADLGVKVEAEFTKGEYNIQVLSAEKSNGLETWLKQEKYKIPKGAAKLFKPYIQGGMYFFAAKVDAKKVKFDAQGQAQLSPLRFHYDSKAFKLPVRLGLINAKGHQDLLVHILARAQRYEVANRKNVTIPTNIVVDEKVKKRFGEFYAALFDATVEQNPGAVVTEYSWQAMKCDPCPGNMAGGAALNASDLYTLGADVVSGQGSKKQGPRGSTWRPRSNWVLTRLHLRYTADELKDDLVFQEAESIIGGRGTPTGEDGTFAEQGAKKGRVNQFQARYAILHPWTGETECQNPRRGIWGGPPRGRRGNQTQAAQRTAFVPRGKIELASLITSKNVPGLEIEPAGDTAGPSGHADDVPDAGSANAVNAADAGSTTTGPADTTISSATTGTTSASNETPAANAGEVTASSGGKCSTIPTDPSRPEPGAIVALLALAATLWRTRSQKVGGQTTSDSARR